MEKVGVDCVKMGKNNDRRGRRARGAARPARRVERRSKSYDCIMLHSEAAAEEPPEPRLLPEGMLFGIDIGGTLAKIVFRLYIPPTPAYTY